jgi:hypothetical protein
LELWLKIFRTSALPALMRVVARISHMVSLPTTVLIVSISRDSERNGVMVSPPKVVGMFGKKPDYPFVCQQSLRATGRFAAEETLTSTLQID